MPEKILRCAQNDTTQEEKPQAFPSEEVPPLGVPQKSRKPSPRRGRWRGFMPRRMRWKTRDYIVYYWFCAITPMYATIISLKLIGFLTPHPPCCAQHLFLPQTGPFCRLRRHFPRARGNHLKEKACKAAALVKYLRIFAVSASLPCVKGGGTALSCDGGIVTKMCDQSPSGGRRQSPSHGGSRDSPPLLKGAMRPPLDTENSLLFPPHPPPFGGPPSPLGEGLRNLIFSPHAGELPQVEGLRSPPDSMGKGGRSVRDLPAKQGRLEKSYLFCQAGKFFQTKGLQKTPGERR